MINPRIFIYLRLIMICVVIINTIAILFINYSYKNEIKDLKKNLKLDIRQNEYDINYVDDTNKSDIQDLQHKINLNEFKIRDLE